jgi:hypothetical protein
MMICCCWNLDAQKPSSSITNNHRVCSLLFFFDVAHSHYYLIYRQCIRFNRLVQIQFLFPTYSTYICISECICTE